MKNPFHISFEGKFANFCQQLFLELDKKNIELEKYFMDHVCFRVESLEEYSDKKKKLSTIGDLLIESEIGGRLISTFKLHKALTYKNRSVYLIELPQPKKGSSYLSGFEHAEFVIDESFDDFSKKYPFSFDWKGTKKEHNPELRLPLTENLSVKFHHQSLEDVIREELNSNSI